MVATITQKVNSAFRQITDDFLDITFLEGEDFSWSPNKGAVHHPPIETVKDLAQLLHEIGHAKLGHQRYPSDAELINMELAAWKYATQIGPKYQVTMSTDDSFVQQAMDSYREWLHDRSVCPNCQAIGMEQSPSLYLCLSCAQQWRVNEARICQLKRYKQ